MSFFGAGGTTLGDMLLTIQLGTPRGPVRATVEDDVVTALTLPDRRAVPPASPPPTLLLRTLQRQLDAYFEDAACGFDVPLRLQGTPFQQRVWRALQQIPAGEVRSYGELARRLDTAPRAIGAACRRNPVPLIVPCHRVVSRHGLGGFDGQRRGAALELKRWLLEHEGIAVEALT